MTELKELHQRPEGALIERALAAPPKMSMRRLAAEVGMSEGRVRQIINGYQSQAGQVLSIVGPSETVARLALVAGVEAADLADAGRPDAAEVLRGMTRATAGQEARDENHADKARTFAVTRAWMESVEAGPGAGPPPIEFLYLYDLTALANTTAEVAEEVLTSAQRYHQALRARNEKIRELEIQVFETSTSRLSVVRDEVGDDVAADQDEDPDLASREVEEPEHP